MPKMEYTLRPEDVYHYLMVYSRKYGFLRSRWLMLLITGLLLIGTLTQAVILITRGYQGRLWMLFTALILLCVLAALMYIFYPHSMKL